MLLLRTSRGVDPGIPLLRSLGSNAHVWLPGANGVSVASLASENYLLSAGSTGYSTVDGVDGLTLDGMGALGSELLAVQDLTTWSVTAGTPTINNATTVTYVGDGQITKAISTVAGRAYWLTIAGSKTGGNIIIYSNADQNSTGVIVNGTFGTYYFVAQATGFIGIRSGTAQTVTVTSISVKEYTGTHLTQATTANKPLVRRGMHSLLVWSRDYTSGFWGKSLCSATANTVTFTAVSAAQMSQSFAFSAAPYTIAALVSVTSGTKTFRFKYWNGTTDAFSSDFTATTTPTIYAHNMTGTAGGNFALANGTAADVGTIAVDGIGLFLGTWTAAQILAEGGIPTTTAAAASNPSAGKYWWSFDGSNDSLLSGNLGITNACTIVIAGRVNSLGSSRMLLNEDTNGVQFVANADGSVVFGKAGIVNFVTSSAGTLVAGVPFVLTIRLSGSVADIRKNGVQVASAATGGVTFSATTGMRVGAHFPGGLFFCNGAIGWVVPLPVALSDADCLTVERLVSSQFPNGPVF